MGTYIRKYRWSKDGTIAEFKWQKQKEVPPLCEDEIKLQKKIDGSPSDWILVEEGWKTGRK